MARLELDLPGLEQAARNALRAAIREHERSLPLRTSVTPARDHRAIGDWAHDLVRVDWQVARLERFLAELRALATREGGPA